MSQLEFSREGRKMEGVYSNGCIYDVSSSLAMANASNGTVGVLNRVDPDYDVGRYHIVNTQASEVNINPRSSFSQQNNLLGQQNNMLSQHSNYSVYNMNKLSVASHTPEAYHDGKIENSVTYTSYQQESSVPIAKSPVLQIPELNHSQHFTYNLATMTEPNNFELMTSQDYHGNSSQPPHIASSGSLMSSEFPQRMMLRSDSDILSHYEKLDQKVQIQQSHNTVNQAIHASNNKVVDPMATQEISRFPASSTSTIHMANHGIIYGSSKSQVKFFDSHPINKVADEGLQGFMRYSTTDSVEKQVNYGVSGFHLSRNFDIKTSNQYSMDSGQLHSVQEANTGKNMSDFATSVSHENQYISSIHGEGALNTGNSTSMTIGKIWDGNLQLNTSTTISTVAYFRRLLT